jgi:hypothetical protein
VGSKRWVWLGIAAALVMAAGALVWSYRGEFAYARIAVGYAAKQTCSCLHVSGRTLDSCLGDFPEDARTRVKVTRDGPSVRASVLFGAFHAEAMHEDGFGCRLKD